MRRARPGAAGPVLLAVTVLLAVMVLLAAGCASRAESPTAATTEVSLPRATAVQTGDGTWATVAMGQLGDPENTFWQLFYRPHGATRWVDDVAATGTATNGGLGLAATPAEVTVGVLPSQSLTFSPVIASGDGGRTWDDGLLPSGLSLTPEALAAAPAGGRAALVGSRGDEQEVLTSRSGLTGWSAASSVPTLAAATATASCGVTDLCAVAYREGGLVLGAGCRQPGVVGVISLQGGRAQMAGPRLDAPAAQTEVLGLALAVGQMGVLVEARAGGRTSLVVAGGAGGSGVGGAWQVSAPLPLGPSESVQSVVADGAGFLVLLTGPGSGPRLYAAGGAPTTEGWRALPDPPAGTATVAPVGSDRLSALAVAGATLTAWDLAPGQAGWSPVQTLQVPILYGSSS